MLTHICTEYSVLQNIHMCTKVDMHEAVYSVLLVTVTSRELECPPVLCVERERVCREREGVTERKQKRDFNKDSNGFTVFWGNELFFSITFFFLVTQNDDITTWHHGQLYHKRDFYLASNILLCDLHFSSDLKTTKKQATELRIGSQWGKKNSAETDTHLFAYTREKHTSVTGGCLLGGRGGGGRRSGGLCAHGLHFRRTFPRGMFHC